MAKKAKKRVVARKKSPKRGKASAKPARKKVARRAAPSKAKSKVRRAGRSAAKPAAKKKQPPKIVARRAPRPAVKMPVATTIVDVIEKPVPGVVVVREYEPVRTAAPVSPGPLPKREGNDPGTQDQ